MKILPREKIEREVELWPNGYASFGAVKLGLSISEEFVHNMIAHCISNNST